MHYYFIDDSLEDEVIFSWHIDSGTGTQLANI